MVPRPQWMPYRVAFLVWSLYENTGDPLSPRIVSSTENLEFELGTLVIR